MASDDASTTVTRVDGRSQSPRVVLVLLLVTMLLAGAYLVMQRTSSVEPASPAATVPAAQSLQPTDPAVPNQPADANQPGSAVPELIDDATGNGMSNAQELSAQLDQQYAQAEQPQP